ncbi:hypothetical protein LR002_01415, partial [Candidatus Gracilibacteria bacterium]|nr:hypothetical protein [Candidatus Gracilibacteria bacterium]
MQEKVFADDFVQVDFSPKIILEKEIEDGNFILNLRAQNFNLENQIAGFQFDLFFDNSKFIFENVQTEGVFVNEKFLHLENFFEKDDKIFFIWHKKFSDLDKNFLEIPNNEIFLKIIFSKKENILDGNFSTENQIFGNYFGEKIGENIKNIVKISSKTGFVAVDIPVLIESKKLNFDLEISSTGSKVKFPKGLEFKNFTGMFLPPKELNKEVFKNLSKNLKPESKIISIGGFENHIYLSQPADVEFNVEKCFDRNFIKYFDNGEWKDDGISDVFCEDGLIKFKTNHFSIFTNDGEDGVIPKVISFVENIFHGGGGF